MRRLFSTMQEHKEDRMREMTYDNLEEYSFKGKEMWAKVLDVYDGDTITVTVKVEDKYYRMNCRLQGIDTPELKSEDQEEKDAAKRARQHLIELLTGQKMGAEATRKEVQAMCGNVNSVVKVECGEADKYGRTLVEIWKGEECVNEKMKKDGYAGVYDGGTKKNWRTYYRREGAGV